MIKQLLSIRLRKLFVGPLFVSDKKKGASVARILFGIFLYLIVIASFLLLTVSAAVTLAMVCVPLGLDWLYFLLYFLVTFALLFILGIFESKAELYECKDNAILIPMPISARDIVGSRMLVLVIYHYLECAFLFLPALLFYLVFGGTPLALVGGAFFLLLMPPVTASLSAIFGFFLSRLTARIKNKTVFTLVLTLAFLTLYFVGYSALLNGIDAALENLGAIAEQLAAKMSVLRFLGEIVVAKPLPLIVFIAAALLIVGFSLRVVIRFYFRTATEQSSAPTVLHHESTDRARPVMLALIQKELRRFLASANYMLNCGIGLLLAPLAAIFALIKREDLSLLLMSFGLDLSSAAPFAVAIVSTCVMMNFMSGVALSLEGDSFWIVRSMPIRTSHLLLSKVLASLVVSVPFSLLSSALFCILLAPPFFEGVAIFLLPLLLAASASFFHALINAVFPKMKFDNEVAVIKQSVSSLVGSLGSMMIGLGLLYLAIFCVALSASWIFYLGTIALAMIFGIPSFVLLTTVLPKKVEKL